MYLLNSLTKTARSFIILLTLSTPSDYPSVPEPGSPEWRALVERQKDEVEAQTGIRPDILLDVDPADDPQRGRRRR
jgi:hypothetical protein